MRRPVLRALLFGFSWVIASSLPACVGASGIPVLTPEEVLQQRTRPGTGGTLLFQDRLGDLRRFVTSISDPLISNPGDGRFHPASPEVVEAALNGIDPRFVDPLRFDIDILPYPVADLLRSWSDDAAIYISPGVLPLGDAQVHFLVSHETGHQVHRALLPDADRAGWRRYRLLRGIADSTRFSEQAAHRDRPHEIFAEDFRVLFGSPEGAAAGIENSDLLAPDRVPGLRDFFLSLLATRTDPAAAAPALVVRPNPVRAGDLLHLTLPAGVAAELRILDVAGRLVRRLGAVPSAGAGAVSILWDGRDGAGRVLTRGTYYATIRTRSGVATQPITVIR